MELVGGSQRLEREMGGQDVGRVGVGVSEGEKFGACSW